MSARIIKGFEPIVLININALNKMKEYIRQSNKEIGWLGTVVKENGMYNILDVYLFKQEVHETTTEITTDGLNEFAMEILSQEDGMEIWNNMKMWGHSHVNMSTSPSVQDDNQMDLFTQNANDFFIRIIANKKYEFRIDVWDYEKGVIYEKLNYIIDYGKDAELIQELQMKIFKLQSIIDDKTNVKKEMIDEVAKEIKGKVKEKTLKTYPTYNNSYGYKYGYDDYGYNAYDWNSKKNEIKSETRRNVSEIFEELSETDVFEMMYAIEYLNGIDDVIDVSVSNQLTVRDIVELEDMVSEYCAVYRDKYEEYLLGN